MKRPSYIRKDGKKVGKGLPKAQTGRQPIYVTDPNDPRLKAYSDSLATHNLSRKIEKIFDVNPVDSRLENYNKQAAALSRRTGIKPVEIKGSLGWREPFRENRGPIDDAYMALYKKPVQPIKYRKTDDQKTETKKEKIKREYEDYDEYQKAVKAEKDSTYLFNKFNIPGHKVFYANTPITQNEDYKELIKRGWSPKEAEKFTKQTISNYNTEMNRRYGMIPQGYNEDVYWKNTGYYYPFYKEPNTEPVYVPKKALIKNESLEKYQKETKKDQNAGWLKKDYGDYMRFQSNPNFETYVDKSSPWLGTQYYVREKKQKGGSNLPKAQILGQSTYVAPSVKLMAVQKEFENKQKQQEENEYLDQILKTYPTLKDRKQAKDFVKIKQREEMRGPDQLRQTPEPQSKIGKFVDIAANPFLALDTYRTTGTLPDYFTEKDIAGTTGALDIPYFFTGAGLGTAAAETVKNLPSTLANMDYTNPWDYAGLGLDLAMIVPGVKGVKKIMKSPAARLAKRKAAPYIKPVTTLATDVARAVDNAVITPIQFRKEIKELKELHKAYPETFKKPEVQERLKKLGINPEDIAMPDLKFISGIGSEFQRYGKPYINIDFRQDKALQKLGYKFSPRSTYEHELGHHLQYEAFKPIMKKRYKEYGKAYESYRNNLSNWEKILEGYQKNPNISNSKIRAHMANKPMPPDMNALMLKPSNIDQELRNIRYSPYKINPKKLEYYKSGKWAGHMTPITPERSMAYFQNSLEPMPHLREMRQGMIESGIISNPYQEITGKNILEYVKANPNDRIASFISERSPNIIKLKNILNRLPAAAPVIGAGAALGSQQEYRKGGDLPKAQKGPLIPPQFIDPKMAQVMANQKPQPQLKPSYKSNKQMEEEARRGEYIENPSFMDYLGQTGYMPYAFLKDPFNMGETLKQARKVASDPKLSAYGRVKKGMDEIVNPALPQVAANLAIGELAGGLANAAIKKAIPAPQMMSNLFTSLPEKVAYSTAKYKFPKYPLKSAKSQVDIDPVHYRAVDYVKSNVGSKVSKSKLVNPQFGQDYILPEGIDVHKLNAFAQKVHKGEIEPYQINDVYESIVKLNPELKNVDVPKADLIHGVASHIAPQDLINIRTTAPIGFVDPSKGFLGNFIKAYQEARWDAFTNKVDALGNEGLDFRFSPSRQKEIMKSFKPTNPYKTDLDLTTRNPLLGEPAGTLEDIKKSYLLNKYGIKTDVEFPEYQGKLDTDLIKYNRKYGTNFYVRNPNPTNADKLTGYTDIPQFNQQLREQMATMQFGKRPTLSKNDFWTIDELNKLIKQYRDYYQARDAFEEMNPESPSMMIFKAMSGDKSSEEVFKNLFPNAKLPNFRSKFINPAELTEFRNTLKYEPQFQWSDPLNPRTLKSNLQNRLTKENRLTTAAENYKDMLSRDWYLKDPKGYLEEMKGAKSFEGLSDSEIKAKAKEVNDELLNFYKKRYLEDTRKPLRAIEALQWMEPNKKGGQISKQKAREILHDKTAHGQPLTEKQKRYFGWIAGGGKPRFQDGGEDCESGDCSPEGYEKEIRDVEQRIGNPSQWTMEGLNELQDKLNEYKWWRENTPEGKAVVDYHNEPNEYVVFPPAHLNKDLYNMKRALELGYQPDETAHWPSVDYESGEYLKSKKHPTAWMEYLYGYTMNPEQALNYDVRVNPEGYFGEDQLQYIPKKAKGGAVSYMKKDGTKVSMMKKGGQLRKYQTDGQTQPFVNQSQEFLKAMVQSPLFAERYAKMTGVENSENAEKAKQQILENLANVQYKQTPKVLRKGAYGIYYPQNHKVMYANPEFSTLLHETSHASTKGNELLTKEQVDKLANKWNYNPAYGSQMVEDTFGNYDNKEAVENLKNAFQNLSEKIFVGKNPKQFAKNKKYYTNPSEQKARIDVARQFLSDKGLYDPINQNFTEKDYNKLKDEFLKPGLFRKLTDEKGSSTKDIYDLLNNYSKEDIIDMFNSYVSNKSNNLKGYAKKGGPIVTTEGFKMGPPPKGNYYRIPSDTLYNPTDYTIEAIADTGERKVLQPRTGNTKFAGASYVDEYQMKKNNKPSYELKPENKPLPKSKPLETNQTLNKTIRQNKGKASGKPLSSLKRGGSINPKISYIRKDGRTVHK